METTDIRQFLSWILDIKNLTQEEAVKYAALQLGIEPSEIEEWLSGIREPAKSAQILLTLLLRRAHFIEEPDLSSNEKVIAGTKKYPCVIYWSEEDRLSGKYSRACWSLLPRRYNGGGRYSSRRNTGYGHRNTTSRRTITSRISHKN